MRKFLRCSYVSQKIESCERVGILICVVPMFCKNFRLLSRILLITLHSDYFGLKEKRRLRRKQMFFRCVIQPNSVHFQQVFCKQRIQCIAAGKTEEPEQ